MKEARDKTPSQRTETAFDGAYIEVGTHLLLSGYTFSCTSGFGLQPQGEAYEGILSQTGDLQITSFYGESYHTTTMHVVDPVESDVSYGPLQDFYYESEYVGSYTQSQSVVVYKGQNVHIDCFVGTSDGSVYPPLNNPFSIGDNGLIYGTANETGTYTFEMVENDDGYIFILYISVIEEESLIVQADMDDGSEPITIIDARVFGDTNLSYSGLHIDAPDTDREGYTFIDWDVPSNVLFTSFDNGTLLIGPPSAGSYTITAKWERNAIPLVFESDPISDGILIPPNHHLVRFMSDFSDVPTTYEIVEHGGYAQGPELPYIGGGSYIWTFDYDPTNWVDLTYYAINQDITFYLTTTHN